MTPNASCSSRAISEWLSSCDDGSAFAQSVYTDLQTLEAMLEDRTGQHHESAGQYDL